jgi:hypothetical protein
MFGFHVQKTIELQASFWLAHYLFQGHGINFIYHQTNGVSCVINSHHIPSPHVVHYLLN